MPKPPHICVVRGCSNSSRKDKIQFFCFPTNEEFRRKWAQFACYEGIITSASRICGIHFVSENFQGPYELKTNVIPSLCAPKMSTPTFSPLNPISSSTPRTPNNVTSITSITSPLPSPKPCVSFPSSLPSTSRHMDFTFLSTHTSPDCVQRPLIQLEGFEQNCFSTQESSKSDVHSVDLQMPVLPTSSLHLSRIETTCISEVISRKKLLFQQIKKKEKALKRLQKKYICNKQKLVQDMMKFRKVKFYANLLGGTAGFLFESEVLNANPKGRIWSLDEKISFLALYKRSPHVYRFLSSLLTLPSPATLRKLLHAGNFRTGINEGIFTVLRQSMISIPEKDRLCYLMFDEMPIKGNLRYNPMLDLIEGLEDRGHLGRTKHIAKFAQVFMLRSLAGQWKQPIAFYFTAHGMPSNDLQLILKEVLLHCWKADCNVLATVCDMGSNNRAALNALGSSPSSPFFYLEGKKVVTLFDVPHLLKCTRNALLHNNIKCTVQQGEEGIPCSDIASWVHIRTLFNTNKLQLLSLVPKLTENHVAPMGRHKRKVLHAAQVLSYNVAAHLFNGAKCGFLPTAALATSTLVKSVNDLFDSLNGTGMPSLCDEDTDFQHSMTLYSGHRDLWKKKKEEIMGWKFMPNHSSRQLRTFPFQEGWITTMNGMEHLFNLLQEFHMDHLSPRSVNQDAIENLFGLIQSHCGCNVHPTEQQFTAALKTCIINGLAYCDILNVANCEPDDADLLSNLREFLCCDDNTRDDDLMTGTTSSNEPTPGSHHLLPHDEFGDIDDVIWEHVSVAYVAGYVARRVLNDGMCNVCRHLIVVEDPDLFEHAGISFRECSSDLERLTYPSLGLMKSVSQGANLVDKMLDDQTEMTNIRQTVIRSIVEKVEFDWLNGDECAVDHMNHTPKIIEKIAWGLYKIFVPWFCVLRNRELRWGN